MEEIGEYLKKTRTKRYSNGEGKTRKKMLG